MPPRPGLTADTIIQAAAWIVDTEGLQSLAITQLAERMGVSVSSLYHHLDGLDGVYRGLSIRGLQGLTEAMSRAAIGWSKSEAVQRMALAYREFALAHPGLYAAAMRAVPPDDREWGEAAAQRIRLMQSVLNAYHLTHEQRRLTSRSIFSLIHGYVSMEALGGFPVQPDEGFRLGISLLVSGLERAIESHEFPMTAEPVKIGEDRASVG